MIKKQNILCTLLSFFENIFRSMLRKYVICIMRATPMLYEVVGWCEGVMYLMSPGRPADIGLQLGKACYPCSR